MGIPSYYKKLVHSINASNTSYGSIGSNESLITTSNHDIDWLFMDFNCLIYHCITPYTEEKEQWEESLLERICTYSLYVSKQVAPKMGVFIAIDGVVPMAKMRQQRLRRFKSIWSDSKKWDTNAITPGTEFMKKLHTSLTKMINKLELPWTLSSSDEPGEGEHKILAEWRKGTYRGDFAIYGLDADLIILSMLGQECYSLHNNIWLFREVQDTKEVKEVKRNKTYNEFEWFSINVLRDSICTDRLSILNYCCAMSILGNDFLPSSLGLKIRDNGHSYLCTLLSHMASQHIYLVDPDTLDLCTEGIKWLFTALSSQESQQISTYIIKKMAMSVDVPLGHNDWPLTNIEEKCLVGHRGLHPSWKRSYLSLLKHDSISTICDEYIRGIQWIWNYYTGRPVCFNWYYSFSLPPLWEWLRDHFTTIPEQIIHIRAEDIRPVEQLVLVLPLQSWDLIPSCPEKRFPILAPQFYPEKFTFESVGKRFFWECEANIPIPTIIELKTIM